MAIRPESSFLILSHCLVIGNLAQFRGEHGINEGKFRSFELYRRNTWRPEILTFDELLERAKFIVLHGEQAVAAGAQEGASVKQ
jgi:hypothetical protein